MRTRIITLCACILLSGSGSYAAPPTLKIDSEIEAKGDYVTFRPETSATTVAYIGQSGVDPFPGNALKDATEFILPVRGLKEGVYKFTAIAISQNEYTRKDFVIRVSRTDDKPDVIPTPKPKPIDPPTPDPKPDPKLDDAPVETNGLHVTFVYESGKGLTSNQFNVLYGNVVAAYLNTNCDRVRSNPQWRIIDQNTVPLSDPWKSLMTRKRTTIPWVVVVSGKKVVYEGELVDTPAEFVKRLDQYKPKSRTDYCPECPQQYRYQQTQLK